MAISRVLRKLSQDLATSLTMFQYVSICFTYVSHATGGPIQSQTSRGLEIATVSTCHGVTGCDRRPGRPETSAAVLSAFNVKASTSTPGQVLTSYDKFESLEILRDLDTL
jgi:hypothetical protein